MISSTKLQQITNENIVVELLSSEPLSSQPSQVKYIDNNNNIYIYINNELIKIN